MDWRPDIPSLVLGFVLGVLVVLILWRASPFFRRHFLRAKGWVQGRIHWMRSGVEVRFQGETAVYTQKHHLGKDWAPLTDIFVPPRLMAPLDEEWLEREDRGATPMALLWPETAAVMGAPLLPSVDIDQLLQNGRRVIISGPPGAGKTTLLAYLAHRFAVATPDGADEALAEIVPVFVHLAEIVWPGNGDEEESNPLEPLTATLQKRSSPLTAPGIGDMLQRRFEKGQVLLLLDGWDEMAAGQRPSILAWLQSLLSTYKKTRIFVAAGVAGYGWLLPFGFVRAMIMPWRIGAAQSFMEKWTQALAIEEVPSSEAVWRPGQSALEATLRFWRATMTAGADARPLTETDLLKATLPLLQRRKKEEAPLNPEADILAFWQALAYNIMQDGEPALPNGQVVELAAALSPGEEGEVDKGQASRLRKSIGSSSLFVQWDAGKIGFLSPVWRDYFTAVSLAEKGNTVDAEPHLQDPQWQHVWPYFAGLTDPTPLVESVLQADGNVPQTDLFQVAAWMRESDAAGNWRRKTMIELGQMARRSTEPAALRFRALAAMVQTGEEGILKFINQLLEHPDPQLRQMATAVLPLIQDDTIIGLLADRLVDEDPLVRQTAVYSLALQQQNPLTERPLITALIGEDEEVGLVTAELLARNEGPGVQILKEAIEEEDIQVRRAAVHGLSTIDEPWVEPLLVEIERQDEEWFVRSAANGALETIRKRKQPQPWRPVRAADRPWLGEMALRSGEHVPGGRAAVEFILTLFSNSSATPLRVAAAHLLAQLPAKEAIPVMQMAIGDEKTAVRDAAFFAYVALSRAYADG